MRFRRVLLLLFFLSFTGCLDVFFAPPVDLGGGGWEELKLVHSNLSMSASTTRIRLAFGPDGSLYAAYTLPESGEALQVVQIDGEKLLMMPGAPYSANILAHDLGVSPDGILFCALLNGNTPQYEMLGWRNGVFSNEFLYAAANASSVALGFDPLNEPFMVGNTDSEIILYTNSGSVSFNMYSSMPDALQVIHADAGFCLVYASCSNLEPSVFRLVWPMTVDSNADTEVSTKANSVAVYDRASATVHAALGSTDPAIVFRGNYNWAASWEYDNAGNLDITSATDFKMVKDVKNCIVYLAYLDDSGTSGEFNYPVHLLQYRLNDSLPTWKPVPGYSPVTVSEGEYDIAVHPVTGKLYMLAAVPDGTYNDLRLYRYNF